MQGFGQSCIKLLYSASLSCESKIPGFWSSRRGLLTLHKSFQPLCVDTPCRKSIWLWVPLLSLILSPTTPVCQYLLRSPLSGFVLIIASVSSPHWCGRLGPWYSSVPPSDLTFPCQKTVHGTTISWAFVTEMSWRKSLHFLWLFNIGNCTWSWGSVPLAELNEKDIWRLLGNKNWIFISFSVDTKHFHHFRWLDCGLFEEELNRHCNIAGGMVMTTKLVVKLLKICILYVRGKIIKFMAWTIN